MKRTIAVMIFALALIGQAAQAQITKTGYGVAGTPASYNITVSDDGSWIIINGHWWPIQPYDANSPCTHVLRWDAFKKRDVPYGIVRPMTADGTQFMGGVIRTKNQPRWRVTTFDAIAYYTPDKMPVILTRKIIVVVQRDPVTGGWIPRPDLTDYTPLISGTIYIDENGNPVKGIFVNDFPGGLSIVPIPIDHGPMPNEGLLPLHVN